ncbi:hypothetical protein [Pseudonocardia sp. GCM10023141]|uniref:hypothetical protein n=1 Tax=Pseudonocardia sp. GCM10023141 TaxID=3252653 RepID=UPI00361BFAD6
MTPIGPTPTPQQITVALDALRSDADSWVEHAGALHRGAVAVAGLQVDPAAFSFAGSAIAVAYETTRQRVLALLRQGAANFEAIGGALHASAAAYAADETAGVHRLRGIH